MSRLKQELTVFDLTMIAIGATIGSGIFLTPASIAQQLHLPILIMLMWIAGGVMALSGALTFAELGAMMPRAGGIYAYLDASYGRLAGFLYGWAYLWVVNTGGVAALAVAFATYLGVFIPMSPLGMKAAAILGLAVVTVINVRGVKFGGMFSNVFTILKLGAILLLIGAGLLWGQANTSLLSSNPDEFPDDLAAAAALAMIGVLWSYGGWQHATFTAGEAKNPKRSVPVALSLGAFSVVALYLLINVAYLKMLTPMQMGTSEHVAADALRSVIGPAGGTLVAIAIMISVYGTTGIYTMTAPRIYYAMAEDGVFFRRVAEVHPRYGTPAIAIIGQSAWAACLILFWGTFENLISYVVFVDWIFFALAAAGVFILRKRQPDAVRPYKTFGYPVTPVVFIGMAAAFVCFTIFTRPLQAVSGLAFLLAGIPAYFYWKRSLPADSAGKP